MATSFMQFSPVAAGPFEALHFSSNLEASGMIHSSVSWGMQATKAKSPFRLGLMEVRLWNEASRGRKENPSCRQGRKPEVEAA
ncbi:hypothetical protein PAXRUDRAFT_827479 [Paxillus rubicundulus Ve08.2h10]|uniref:Uncharacterized protein n=1 Tax=Paxillus rubicundulus Ve08.2h10 TaxID=930991 RepID=A0A0D0E8I9_9AGAM|nr:hypothetical protein PAXRUDRAFT_827479 [Paxillus rubicundulus Ve08.2h10]